MNNNKKKKIYVGEKRTADVRRERLHLHPNSLVSSKIVNAPPLNRFCKYKKKLEGGVQQTC
jgi:hypothetical protein